MQNLQDPEKGFLKPLLGTLTSAYTPVVKARDRPKPTWTGWESELLPQGWRAREEEYLLSNSSIYHHVTNQSFVKLLAFALVLLGFLMVLDYLFLTRHHHTHLLQSFMHCQRDTWRCSSQNLYLYVVLG